MTAYHSMRSLVGPAGKVSYGAGRAVPNATLSDRKGSVSVLRRHVSGRRGSADSGRSLDDDGAAGFGPKRKFDLTPLGARTGFAAAHSITSPARERIDDGIVRPNALAVLRLITRSNVVGCSTGMSAGLAPRKILTS
jgi:hypothetical protein